ncbi:hypothetical protein HGRIS_002791 [Hohenbuehelia grisea]|uniref:Uncharacterized protein n=1 Tax=Hohenbuehelia grisea TaxID=104357 RepID=A0ABR3JLI1_9AGAR
MRSYILIPALAALNFGSTALALPSGSNSTTPAPPSLPVGFPPVKPSDTTSTTSSIATTMTTAGSSTSTSSTGGVAAPTQVLPDPLKSVVGSLAGAKDRVTVRQIHNADYSSGSRPADASQNSASPASPPSSKRMIIERGAANEVLLAKRGLPDGLPVIGGLPLPSHDSASTTSHSVNARGVPTPPVKPPVQPPVSPPSPFGESPNDSSSDKQVRGVPTLPSPPVQPPVKVPVGSSSANSTTTAAKREETTAAYDSDSPLPTQF